MDGRELPLCDIKCGGMSGRTVAEGEQIAALIVRAVNNHDDLIAALEAANTLLTKAVGDIVAYRIIAGKKTSIEATAEYIAAINAGDDLIAKAKGEA